MWVAFVDNQRETLFDILSEQRNVKAISQTRASLHANLCNDFLKNDILLRSKAEDTSAAQIILFQTM